MPRVLVLVVLAGVLVWAAALAGVDERPQAAAATPEPSEPVAAPVPADPPGPTAAAAPRAEPEAVTVAAKPLPLTRVQPAGPRSLWASASATMRAARDALTPGAQPARPAGPPAPQPGEVATGELGEGILSPEYAAIERAYVYEPRDSAWAADQEGQIRALVGKGPLAQKLAIVNCQQTICRVVFEGAPEDAFKQLLQVPGLADLTGLGPTTPYSYRAGQLSVYFSRRSAIIAAGP